MWRQLFQATWKTYKSNFDPLVGNIRVHGDLVQRQATMTEIENQRKAMETQNDQLKSIREMEKAHMLREVYSWLSAPNIDNDHYHYSKIREEHSCTGRWLLDIPAFKEWFDPMYPTIPPLLWITGIPGAGNYNDEKYCMLLGMLTKLQVKLFSLLWLLKKLESCLPLLPCSSIAKTGTPIETTLLQLVAAFCRSFFNTIKRFCCHAITTILWPPGPAQGRFLTHTL